MASCITAVSPNMSAIEILQSFIKPLVWGTYTFFQTTVYNELKLVDESSLLLCITIENLLENVIKVLYTIMYYARHRLSSNDTRGCFTNYFSLQIKKLYVAFLGCFMSDHHKFCTSPNSIAVGACAKFVAILLYLKLQKYFFLNLAD